MKLKTNFLPPQNNDLNVQSNFYVMDTFQGGFFGLTGKALAPAELPIDFYGEKIT